LRILITGVAGFIGFRLADKLLKKGHTVYGLDNLNDYYSVKLKNERLKILEDYKSAPSGNRKKLLNYFIKNRLKTLTESIGEF